MRITILAPGSRGDIQPYIALGEGLRRAGHRVRLVTNKEFADLVKSAGLDILPIDVSVQAALQTPDASAAIERGSLISSFRKLAELARTATRLLLQAGLDAGREADLIIAGFAGMLVGASIAEKLGLPFIQAYNVPFTPTAAFPGALTPWLSFPPRSLTHRLGHRLTRQVLWQTARTGGSGVRRDLGLPPAPLLGMFDRPIMCAGPLLYGFSPSVLPRPIDWEERIHVTGYWFTNEPEDWQASPELRRFLDAQPAPIYIGFGSMSSENPKQTTQVILDALAVNGRRAIVHSGWAGLAQGVASENVLVVGSVPHSWLFPRVAAVVHHGGAGTTAAAFRAGVPSIVIPFHGDQPFWARLTEKLGVGTKPIPRRKLAVPPLAAAIEEALTSESLRQNATELGKRVQAEDGVGQAVEIIESAMLSLDSGRVQKTRFADGQGAG
jgi:sterol 3beta-glucosyltransferase